MRLSLQQILFQTFSTLYRGRKKDCRYSSMCFGFEIGDGWFNLIYDLSDKITQFGKKNKIKPFPEVLQVKEKFGKLRFYMLKHNDDIDKLINEAEEESSKICFNCGSKENITKTKEYNISLCKECFNRK